jgi:hypothetical protein
MGYTVSNKSISSTIDSENFKGDKETVNEGAEAAETIIQKRLTLLEQEAEKYNLI